MAVCIFPDGAKGCFDGHPSNLDQLRVLIAIQRRNSMEILDLVPFPSNVIPNGLQAFKSNL